MRLCCYFKQRNKSDCIFELHTGVTPHGFRRHSAILVPLRLRVRQSGWCQQPCICVFLMDTRQSFSEVGLFCGGRADVTELSLENDGVRQRRANGCRRSSQSAEPLVMMRWWMRSAGVCRQALHPSQARTKHKAYTGWNVSSILVDEGCVLTKQDAIPIHSVLTQHPGCFPVVVYPFKPREWAFVVYLFFST